MLRDLIDPGAAPFCPSPHSNRDLNSLIAHNWIIALDHIDLLPCSILKKLIALSTDRPMIFTTESMLPRDLRSSAIHVRATPQPNPPSQETFHRLRPQICVHSWPQPFPFAFIRVHSRPIPSLLLKLDFPHDI